MFVYLLLLVLFANSNDGKPQYFYLPYYYSYPTVLSYPPSSTSNRHVTPYEGFTGGNFDVGKNTNGPVNTGQVHGGKTVLLYL